MMRLLYRHILLIAVQNLKFCSYPQRKVFQNGEKMNYTQEILGDVVRTSRKSKNLSQEELAERIGACKRTIIDIENNTGNPKFGILYALVRELDLPLYKVFYQEMPGNIKLKNEIIQD